MGKIAAIGSSTLSWSELSPGVQKLIIALIALSFLLMATALTVWCRTDAESMPQPGKTAWLLICLFVSTAGPIAFLIARRQNTAWQKRERAWASQAEHGDKRPIGGDEVAKDRENVDEARAFPAGGGPSMREFMPASMKTGAPAGSAVEFRNVTRAFGEKLALDDVSFQIPAGSVCALLGPNGAGKTTTIRILLGLARADAGDVRILGDPAGSLAVRRRLGYLPDVPAYPAWMSAREYLEASADLAGVPAVERRGRIASLLDLAELAGVSQRIGGYSRGMRQRLGLAQALVGNPDLIVLDEPTSALDPAGRRAVLRLIARLAEHATVILSSHNLEEVQRVCTHAVVLREGKAVAASTISRLRERAGDHSLLLVSGGGDPLAHALKAEPWCAGVRREGADFIVVVSDPSAAARALPALMARGGWDLSALTPLEPSLEDVFTALTEGK